MAGLRPGRATNFLQQGTGLGGECLETRFPKKGTHKGRDQRKSLYIQRLVWKMGTDPENMKRNRARGWRQALFIPEKKTGQESWVSFETTLKGPQEILTPNWLLY